MFFSVWVCWWIINFCSCWIFLYRQYFYILTHHVWSPVNTLNWIWRFSVLRYWVDRDESGIADNRGQRSFMLLLMVIASVQIFCLSESHLTKAFRLIPKHLVALDINYNQSVLFCTDVWLRLCVCVCVCVSVYFCCHSLKIILNVIIEKWMKPAITSFFEFLFWELIFEWTFHFYDTCLLFSLHAAQTCLVVKLGIRLLAGSCLCFVSFNVVFSLKAAGPFCIFPENV